MKLSGDLAGAVIISAIFLALLAGAELWKRLGSPKPEWTRKLVHLGGGIICLLLPFLIDSPWVVLVLAVMMTGMFYVGGKASLLKSVHGVERRTRGSEYYPLAIFLVYVLSYDRPWLYLSSVLTLAVSDAFAALIGGRYGLIHYEVEDEKKSLEGSMAFMLLTFLVIHIPTLLMSGYPPAVSLLAALLVSVLVTGFEAVSLHGTDNLFVPVVVCVVLDKITSKPLSEIIFQNISLVVLCILIAFLARRVRTFNAGGVISFVLFAYGAWSLGSWQWALPVLLGFLVYLAVELLLPVSVEHVPEVRVRVVFRVLLPALLMLIFANNYSMYGFFYGPYVASYSAALALGSWTYIKFLRPVTRWAGALAVAIGSSLAVTFPPWVLQSLDMGNLVAVTGVSILAVLLHEWISGRQTPPGTSLLWSAEKLLLTLGAAVLIVIMQLFSLIGAWNPQ